MKEIMARCVECGKQYEVIYGALDYTKCECDGELVSIRAYVQPSWCTLDNWHSEICNGFFKAYNDGKLDKFIQTECPKCEKNDRR